MKIGTDGICRPRRIDDGDGDPHAEWTDVPYDFVVVPAPGKANAAGWVLIDGPSGVYSCNPTYFEAHFKIVQTLEDLLALVRELPPPTPEQRRAQAIDFVYGNVRMSNPAITREMVERSYDELRAKGELAHIEATTPPAVPAHLGPPEIVVTAGDAADPIAPIVLDATEGIRVAGGGILSSGPPSLAELMRGKR